MSPSADEEYLQSGLVCSGVIHSFIQLLLPWLVEHVLNVPGTKLAGKEGHLCALFEDFGDSGKDRED